MEINLRGVSTDMYSIEDLMDAMKNLEYAVDRARVMDRRADSRIEMPIRWIRNGPATILFWKDGSKTIVKCNEEDEFDAQKGYLMACFEKWTGMSKHQISKLMEKVSNNEEWRSPYYFWK